MMKTIVLYLPPDLCATRLRLPPAEILYARDEFGRTIQATTDKDIDNSNVF